VSGHPKKIVEMLQEAGQEHLLRFWDVLSDAERELLLRDIGAVDFSVPRNPKSLLENGERKGGSLVPPEVIAIPETPEALAREREAREAGESLLRSSRVAAFTAAGGQSSRLGLEAPKGTYPVTPVRNKSLFQVFAEKIRAAEARYGVRIPWVIMVSDTNGEETEGFFSRNGHFGLDASRIRFIEQGMFPAVDDRGRILLREKHRLFLSPSGHGGTFAALRGSGALRWLEELGIEELFYFQVDNVLARVLDPVFIGYHALGRCGMSSKCVRKKNLEEKLGVFALVDGKPAVVEYSELVLIESRLGKGGAALFTAGNVAIHILNLAFAARQAGGMEKSLAGEKSHPGERNLAGAKSLPWEGKLPLHLARKAIPHIDSTGRKVEPAEPNGYKFETFIFDALRNAGASLIVEARREEEFSPLKNRSGDDSPATVLRDQLMLFSRWFESAGIRVPRGPGGLPLHKLEVSPLFALTTEEFAARVTRGIAADRDTYVE
jgi:UDP-N-acetylglucosamine/UDP-N-acetylgalactosamine diphosphorylase